MPRRAGSCRLSQTLGVMKLSCPTCGTSISRWRVLFGGRVIRCSCCGAESERSISSSKSVIYFLGVWVFAGSQFFVWHTKYVWLALALFGAFTFTLLSSVPLTPRLNLSFWQGLKRDRTMFVLSVITATVSVALAVFARSMHAA